MKSIIMLIGPKGSGKTHIGKSIGKELGIRFLEVEKLLIDYIKKNNISNNNLPNHGFDIEREEIISILENEDSVIVEATGSSEYFRDYYKSLITRYAIFPIKINCTYETCLNRIKNRNTINNFNVSERKIRFIYEKGKELKLNWFQIIDNSNGYNLAKLSNLIKQQLKKIKSETLKQNIANMPVGFHGKFCMMVKGKQHTWFVQSLVKATKSLPIIDIELNKLSKYLDKNAWFHGERKPTLRAFIQHYQRVEKVDLSFPIIVNHKYGILDGLHRLAKAHISGHSSIKAVILDKLPEPDYIGNF